MTYKTAAIISFVSLAMLTSPALARNSATSPAATNTGQKIEQRIQKLDNRLTVREGALTQKIAEIREKIASKQAQLRAKLNQFRDQKKASAAARISENLNRINDKQTQQMQKHLDKMATILTRLQDRVEKATPDIKNPTLAKATIASASAAITQAKEAVAAQADKDYTLTGSSEATIRSEAKSARDKLHADLQAVRKLVIAAKQAVANAIRSTKSGKLEIPGKEGTSSGTE